MKVLKILILISSVLIANHMAEDDDDKPFPEDDVEQEYKFWNVNMEPVRYRYGIGIVFYRIMSILELSPPITTMQICSPINQQYGKIEIELGSKASVWIVQCLSNKVCERDPDTYDIHCATPQTVPQHHG